MTTLNAEKKRMKKEKLKLIIHLRLLIIQCHTNQLNSNIFLREIMPFYDQHWILWLCDVVSCSVVLKWSVKSMSHKRQWGWTFRWDNFSIISASLSRINDNCFKLRWQVIASFAINWFNVRIIFSNWFCTDVCYDCSNSVCVCGTIKQVMMNNEDYPDDTVVSYCSRKCSLHYIKIDESLRVVLP